MEQQLRDHIAQVFVEHNAKLEASSGKLLENLKEMDAQLRCEIGNMADAHGAKSERHSANLKCMEQQLRIRSFEPLPSTTRNTMQTVTGYSRVSRPWVRK